jgi:hypothetical protein
MNLERLLLSLAALFCLPAWADSYTYDSLNRLAAVQYDNGGGIAYTYDKAGNRLSSFVTPPSVSDYSLTVIRSGNGGGTVSGSGIDCGSTCGASLPNGAAVTLTASAASGSTFSGWSGACSGTGATCVLTMTAAQSVTASFAAVVPASFTLSVGRSGIGSGTVTSTPAGIDCGTTCSAAFNTSVSLSASATAGSIFTSWSGDCSGLAACVVTMNANRSVTAGFAAIAGGGDLSFPLMLAPGWSLLGNSLNQVLSAATLLSDSSVVTSAWKWDVATTGWQFYSPLMDAPTLQAYAAGKGYGVLSVINPGEGFWVNARMAASLGTQAGGGFGLTMSNLAAGWNLVATGNDLSPSQFNLSLSANPPAPGTVPINVTTVWAWDNASSRWYFHAPSLETPGGTALTDYIMSQGYLDFTQHGKTLGNGVGFWVNRP